MIAEPFVKRPFDFILALTGLALSSPLWLILSLVVYLEDRGPVLFFQERSGRGSRTFHIAKFCTMKSVARNLGGDRRLQQEESCG